jgi:glycosyltransferase involved in cell wall biosynthesis
LIGRLVAWIYRRNDLLLVQSEAFVEAVRARAGSVPVRLHPNPGESLPETELAPPWDLPDGFNVLFAGNLGKVQALDTILDAAEQLREETTIHWTLMGSGSRAVWLQGEVRRRGLTNVHMPGRFAPEHMARFYSQASALLVTLARANILGLTVPSKLQTYLATGRPVVASLDGEGARVVRESAAGVTCPAEDATALAAAVLHLHNLPADERDRMGANGRRYFERHYGLEMLAERLETLLQRDGLAPAPEGSQLGRTP